MNRFFKKIGLITAAILTMNMLSAPKLSVSAADKIPEKLKYYLGETVNTGKDNGYSESNPIDEKDPHYGWDIGKFYVSGYTRVINENTDNPVFLKNVGDQVTLWFDLKQDIDNLNGNKKMKISQDKNGFDTYFGTAKQDFGRGTLIVKHTDYQNLGAEPQVYVNYLASDLSSAIDTQVQLCEEGDYEVALDYEIQKDTWQPWGKSWFPTYENYRIYFKFSVRNGNSMVFPFDVSTKEELTNAAMTEYGFYLDLAKSRYLDINIKREVLKEGAQGLTEDVRFNRPAKDGDRYMSEGIYTITSKNRYTGQETVKKIYVGQDEIMKAYIVTGLPINRIEELLDEGATINEDGSINAPPEPEITETEATTTVTETEATTTESTTVITTTATTTEVTITETSEAIPADTEEKKDGPNAAVIIIIVIGVIGLLGAAVYFTHYYDKKSEIKNKENEVKELPKKED